MVWGAPRRTVLQGFGGKCGSVCPERPMGVEAEERPDGRAGRHGGRPLRKYHERKGRETFVGPTKRQRNSREAFVGPTKRQRNGREAFVGPTKRQRNGREAFVGPTKRQRKGRGEESSAVFLIVPNPAEILPFYLEKTLAPGRQTNCTRLPCMRLRAMVHVPSSTRTLALAPWGMAATASSSVM